MLVEIEKYPCSELLYVTKINLQKVVAGKAKNRIHVVVHRLMVSQHGRRIAHINGVNNVLLQSVPFDLPNTPDDVPMMRHVAE